jgi:hypothetical protein
MTGDCLYSGRDNRCFKIFRNLIMLSAVFTVSRFIRRAIDRRLIFGLFRKILRRGNDRNSM